ncbi:MAG TPA: hypothetical protein PLJ00_08255 [Chitinophagales bacterium]|nr:hypothetical protein [Chitinophagales bacterium]HRG27869.1 hypothetical protein [Chitinophagales bacterium]HRG87193.1 hypothetical protein [Chitinophagales bacterium]HRH53960.1 hypothetical protein [Chitinophagales bacterium]
MYTINNKFWVKLGLFNFSIVAFVGFIMRYKIGYSFPFFDQKNLLHAHSHFAFSGWVSHILMLFITLAIAQNISPKRLRYYQICILLNIICAFGMLIGFTINGYNTFTIIISSISLFTSIAYAIITLSDLLQNKTIPQRMWFIFANCMQIISAAGTASLVLMMAKHQIEQERYLASIYWYLHFQYNGWFFFACMGLFFTYIKKLLPQAEIPSAIFNYFAISCIPAFGLSVLWLNLPILVYITIMLAAICQICGWLWLVLFLKNHKVISIFSKKDLLIKLLFITIFCATTVKLFLQLFSVIPSISEMAFGFRPIVIAYLHLVLLAITSLFLLTYAYAMKFINHNIYTKIALILIAAGVLLNECALGIQGIASLSYTPVPHIDQILVIISGILVVGILAILLAQLKSSKQNESI